MIIKEEILKEFYDDLFCYMSYGSKSIISDIIDINSDEELLTDE